MMSVEVYFDGKGRLHFVEERAKVNDLQPNLVECCHDLLGNNCVPKDDAQTQMMQHRLSEHCLNITDNDRWTTN